MKYIKNMITFYLAFVLNFLAGFALIKILAIYMPQETLGLYFFASNAGLFFGGLLLLGFPLTIQRFVPMYIRDDRIENASALIHVPALIHITAGIFISILLLLTKGIPSTSIFLAFYILNTITLYQTALISNLKIFEYSLTSFARIFVIVCLVLFSRPFLTLKTLGIINLATNMAFLLILFSLFPVSTRRWRETLSEIKDYWKYALLNQLLAPFFHYLDSMLIPMFLPYSQLSLFQIGRKLDMGARQTMEVPLQLTAPLISFKRTDQVLSIEFAKKFRAFRLLYFYLAFFWFLLFEFAGKEIIRLISTPAYLPSYPYLMVLSFTLLLSTLYSADAMLARATGNMRLFFFKDVVWVACFVISFFLLTKPLGLQGTVLSFVIATTSTALFHIYNYKVLHPTEYLYEFVKIAVIGIQAIIFTSSRNFLPSVIILVLIVSLDFKNFRNAIKIIAEHKETTF